MDDCFQRPDFALRMTVLLARTALAGPGSLNVFCGWLPRCKHKMMNWPLVGCSRLSGLFVQSVETAGPDGVHEQGPIGFAGYCA